MKNKIMVILFLVVIYGFFFLNIIIPDKDVSKNERRKLESFPKITISSLLNKDFMDKFDNYSVDQFSFRDTFRSIKASYAYNLLGMLDNNGVFVEENGIYKNLYPTNKKSIKSFINKMNILNERYLSNNNVYFGVIPDKNYYLENDKYLRIDYDYLYDEVKENLSFNYIELRDCLELDDYYRTDTHWKQEELVSVVRRINSSLGFGTDFSYSSKTYYPFYGVYYGQAALDIKPDTITYLSKDYFNEVVVDSYDKKDILYDEELLKEMDSYDVYLGGATPLVTIVNPNSNSDRELVLIRDSFGSSLAPLLIDNYQSITIVDLRYMSLSVMEELVDFTDKDILILYSTLIVNDSNSLKIY